MEIEPIYIVGDFALRFEDEPKDMNDGTYHIAKQPSITKTPATVDAERLDYCGYPEFAGEITLTKKVTLEDNGYYCHLEGNGINAIRLSVNGEHVSTKLYAPYRVDLCDYLKAGENEIEITLVNNLRNMMGPHHLASEVTNWVCPGLFYKESNIFEHKAGCGADCHDRLDYFDDRYLLVHYGIK